MTSHEFEHEKTLVCKGPFSLQVQVRSGSSIRTNDLDITERGYEHGPGFSGSFDIHVTFTIKKASSRSCNPSFFIVEFCEKKKKKKEKKSKTQNLGLCTFFAIKSRVHKKSKKSRETNKLNLFLCSSFSFLKQVR